MDDLYNIIKELKNWPKIKNKFPHEALPKNGLIIDFYRDINGLIRNSKGNILKNDSYNYVITKTGGLKIGFKHHFLGNADDVLAAGSIKTKNGWISEIDNLSGHYKPTLEEALNFEKLFKIVNLPIKRANLKIYKFVENTNGYVDFQRFKTIEIKNIK